VSDVTTPAERSSAFGIVSATFAASLVISPALGSLIQAYAGNTAVFVLSTVISVVDVAFVLFFVPESKPPSPHAKEAKDITWAMANPFRSMHIAFKSHVFLILSVTVFFRCFWCFWWWFFWCFFGFPSPNHS
jgi:predicted MFS family arabinose efflux permease